MRFWRTQVLKDYRAAGNRTQVCSKPVDFATVQALSDKGLVPARLWTKLDDPEKKPGPEATTPKRKASKSVGSPGGSTEKARKAPAALDLVEARRRHAINAAVHHHTFRSLSSPCTRWFLQALETEYDPPNHNQVAQIITEQAALVEKALRTAMLDSGPWALMGDGATQRGQPYVNVLAT